MSASVGEIFEKNVLLSPLSPTSQDHFLYEEVDDGSHTLVISEDIAALDIVFGKVLPFPNDGILAPL